MTLYSDVVSIAATTAGVSGTITVPMGARLLGLNMALVAADPIVITSIEIKWAGLQTPIKYVPSLTMNVGANGSGNAICKSPLIDLRKLPAVANANSVTITVISTANQTVEIGLMWIA